MDSFLDSMAEKLSSSTSKTVAFFLLLWLTGVYVTFQVTPDDYRALMVGLGAMAVGNVVGFLFGIPRSPGSTAPPEETEVDVDSQAEGENGPDAEPGASKMADSSGPTGTGRPTNLEEISDWLSKVLIGAGLVGLKDGVKYIRDMAGTISTELGGNLQSFAVALVLYFFSLGLLFSYILTRTYLTGIFARARKRVLSQLERQAKVENQPDLLEQVRSLRKQG